MWCTVNAQLGWSDEESRTLLQLYPQVLVSHLSSGDHQPIEELWLQLAKAFMSNQQVKKQCYEVSYKSSLCVVREAVIVMIYKYI